MGEYKNLIIIYIMLIGVTTLFAGCGPLSDNTNMDTAVADETKVEKEQIAIQEELVEKDNELTYIVNGKEKEIEVSLETIMQKTGYTQRREAIPYRVAMKLPKEFKVTTHNNGDTVQGIGNFENAFINFELRFISEDSQMEPKRYAKFQGQVNSTGPSFYDIKEVNLNDYPNLVSVFDAYHTSIRDEFNYGDGSFPPQQRYTFTKAIDRSAFSIMVTMPQSLVNPETEAMIQSMASTIQVDILQNGQ